MINDIPDESLIFIDETGINLHLKTHYGYAPTGMASTLNEPANRGQNISCLVAISISGVVSFCIEDGMFAKMIFVLQSRFYFCKDDYDFAKSIIEDAKYCKS
ncbi:hypothetical protein RF11_11501 [Thelohanellus kitauei]|uniref:Tc1-like transposase DDE domain-containing protein n=1 Tax=Thelohanellus kitauei TaxID=669202 RepID=A0A0C2MJN1_THEKT|nr:hypothetical protein RF11_11501 [Thelohanellus kitauei]